ncbi:hypothetical protein [Paraburkholderia rhizosphaerae]|uniref:Uncharacterized protein n=1 Tax=Paraburkholderia rhizosphaerae TaxID=480658 RepID=A0A4R8LP71_9BURK|nr:hypothetical protein [Paraburkholderia rhizosphaerae]TDY48087.1 hypothetical protein BX592_11120 [Paraburkholderia rhizosphaerae]
MKPEHLWNMLVGTVTIEPATTSGAPTRVTRRAMPQRVAELLALPEEQWTAADRALVSSIRDLAGVLMRGPLLDSEAAGFGIGIGVTKELLVCLAAFAPPVDSHATAGTTSQNMRDVMLSNLRVL